MEAQKQQLSEDEKKKLYSELLSIAMSNGVFSNFETATGFHTLGDRICRSNVSDEDSEMYKTLLSSLFAKKGIINNITDANNILTISNKIYPVKLNIGDNEVKEVKPIIDTMFKDNYVKSVEVASLLLLIIESGMKQLQNSVNDNKVSNMDKTSDVGSSSNMFAKPKSVQK